MYMRGSTAYGNNNPYSNKCSAVSAKFNPQIPGIPEDASDLNGTGVANISLSSSQASLNSEGNDDETDATTPFAPLEEEEYDSDLDSHDEPESWSELVDKKVQCKMRAKDIKRQDVIYELIQTEAQYVRTLQIMKKIYHDGMKRHLNYTPDILSAMFPCLEELIQLNGGFLREMKKEQIDNSENYVVKRIGNIILNHFGGETGKQFRDCYGYFCSHHLEAVALYKDFWKNDNTFQQFNKKCLMSARSGRLSIPEIITYVTIRMTKYPLLIEAIIKGTKDTDPDLADLKKSLNAIKEILIGVDEDVDAHEQEKELINLMKMVDSKHFVDIKSEVAKGTPSRFRANKLFHKRSRLLYDKKVMLKSKNKYYDTRMVILSDKIIFFQENGGKLQLLNVDNKMPVMPLKGVMVREVATDPKALFLMNKSEQLVELYEIIFEKNKDKPELMPKLDKFIANCPDEEEENITDNEEEARREEEERVKRLKDLVDQLENANQEIKSHFETKSKIVQQLIEVTDEDGCLKAGSPSSEIKMVDVYNTRSLLEDFLMQVNAVLQSCSTPSLSPDSSPGQSSRSFTLGNHNSTQHISTKKSDTFGGFDNRNKPNVLNNNNRTSNKPLPRGASSEPDMAHAKRRQSQLMQVLGRVRATGSNEDLNSSTSTSNSSLSSFVPPSLAEMQVYQHLSEGLGSLLEVTNQQDLEIARMRNHLKESQTLHAKTEAELSEMRERLIQQQKDSERQLRIEKENYAKLSKEYKRSKGQSLKLTEQRHQRHQAELRTPNSEEMIV